MSKSITWKVIIICSLFLIISGWVLAGKDNLFAYSDKDNKTQPGVLMLLLDDPAKPPPQPAGTLPVLDTGQTRCYDNAQEITCPEPGEPFYGQDAHYQPRIPRSYTKLGTGGIELLDDEPHIDAGGQWIMTRDNVTGLVWEVKTEDEGLRNKDNTYTWYNPDADNQGTPDGGDCTGSACDTYFYIQALNHPDLEFGGFSDWRVPSRQELSSLIDRDDYNPVIETHWFPHTSVSNYWTSTAFPTHYPGAWRLDFFHGLVGGADKTVAYHVRAVRGGQPGTLPHIIDNEDGTLTDQNSGLMWQKCNKGESWNETTIECEGTALVHTWEEALSAAESLRLAGYYDWRLPNINELQSLVDDSKFNPAILDQLAAETKSNYYWSSTTYHGVMNMAWIVYFFNGFVLTSDKEEGKNYMRAVRTVTD